ncbi:MAG TPA: DUF1186 domain-containing protein [bacterium]|nr:DUF1186 domain-containing protein [bacterium]
MYEDVTPEELIEKLEKAGTSAPVELIQEIVKRKETALPILLSKFLRRSYWEATDEKDLIPFYTLYILSILGDPDLMPYILKAIVMIEIQDRDDLVEVMPIIIRDIGAPAIEPLKEFISENPITNCRILAANGLIVIALKYPEYKEEILNYIRSLLREDENPDFLSLLSFNLIDIGDELSLPRIKELLEKGILDPFIIDKEDLEEGWNAKDLSILSTADPLEFYLESYREAELELNELKDEEMGKDLEKKISQELEKFEALPKFGDKIDIPKKLPGRNDPCFCGSGKKFKKCCLPLIESLQVTKEIYSQGYYVDDFSDLSPYSIILSMENITALAIDLANIGEISPAVEALEKIKPVIKEKGFYLKYLETVIPKVYLKHSELLEEGLELALELEKYTGDLEEKEEKIKAGIFVSTALLRMGREKESREKLENLLNTYADHPLVCFEYASLMEDTGNIDKAVEYYVKALERKEELESSTVEEILDRLAFLVITHDIKLEEKYSSLVNAYLLER